MSQKLFVGGLPFDLQEQDLHEIFAEYGPLISVKIITDKFTNRSRGFGFIEVQDDEKANLACSEMNGGMIDDKKIVVSIAHPPGSQENKPRGGFRREGTASRGPRSDFGHNGNRGSQGRSNFRSGGGNRGN